MQLFLGLATADGADMPLFAKRDRQPPLIRILQTGSNCGFVTEEKPTLGKSTTRGYLVYWILPGGAGSSARRARRVWPRALALG